VVASVAAAAALGWAVEVWLYRPLRVRRASSDALFLTSLGVYTVVANALALAAGHDTKPLAGFSNPSHVLRAGGEGLPLVITQAQVLTMAVALVLFVGLWPVLKLSRFGLAMRAYAANPTLASVLGVDDRRLLPRVAALGAGLGGVAAWCTALDVGVSPDMGLAAVVTGAVAVVVGGVGSLPGTALGGLLLGLLQQCGRLWLDARWEEAVTFGVLLGVLLLRPRGLLGGAQG
jgi:branched-chain amino acid transport system permease protein